jgi:hypothetical protein
MIITEYVISEMEKHMQVTARVPPITINMDGGFMKEAGSPPRMMADITRPKPDISPIIVARSIEDRALPTLILASSFAIKRIL